MYYYIFDIKKISKKSQVDSIKGYLSTLGISGEFTYPTTAQTVDELVDLGISKQYTTIVAVGGDEICNQVAAKLAGRKEAMGIIPIEASFELNHLIGTDSWKEACEILRFRKINEIRVGKTATQKYFLTSAGLLIKTPIEVTIELKDFIIQTIASELVISNFNPYIRKIGTDFLDITITSVGQSDLGIVKRLGNLLGKRSEGNLNKSLIRARSLRIFTKTQLPIVAGNQIIAKAPQFIESSDEDLRLITSKKTAIFWN